MKRSNTYRFSKAGFFSNYTLEADFENPVTEPNGAGVKIDGWTHYSPSTTLSVESHNGSDWLKVVSTNGTHGAHQGFSVEPGETYTFEIDLHRPSGMNNVINIVIWKNTGPSGALSIHVLNTDGFNTFNYTATSSNIYIQIRQAGTYYLDNIRMYRIYQDTVFVGGFEMDMAYRYGFGGQEKDNEVSGKGNSYTAEFWQYSPRLGKRWNIDPVVKPHESPYATFANNPIWFIDPSGADTSFFDDDGNYDQQAKDDFMTAYNTVKSKIKYIENEISTIQNDIKERQEAGKRTRKQNKRLSKMQGLLEDWQKLEKDFDDIISDETIFVYSSERGDIDSKFAGQTGSSEDVFNEKTGRWAKIHIFIEGGRDDIIIHENRHANQRREDPHLSNQHANQLDREKDAYMYHEIYNFQRVEEFIKNQYDSQHGLKDEINRPLFSSYTLEDAIKYFYGIK